MKSMMTFVLLAAASNLVAAADFTLSPAGYSFQVERKAFGSGTPATASVNGAEAAEPVADGLYHVPNFLPGFPTAATIWPREIPVECATDSATGKTLCGGYQVLPVVGRGEYLFVRPVVKNVPVPAPAPAAAPPAPEPLPVATKKPLG